MIEAKTREEALRIAEKYEENARTLIDRYGDGVRPSWVSTDISIAWHYAEQYRNAADEMEE